MGMFSLFDIAGSAMTAQSQRLSTIASNLANAESSASADGKPYRARQVVFQVQPLRDLRPSRRGAGDTVGLPQPEDASGVRVARVVESQAPLRQVYQPGHPQADANGMVAYPNVDPVEEMTNMIAASRAYQFNVEVMNTSRILIQRTLEIGR